MRKPNRQSERGIALIFTLLALLVLSAIAIGLMFMSSTEASVSGNFKGQEKAYFAARAGVEEVRARMLTTNANSLASNLPTALPTAGGKVLYVLQQGVTIGDVTTNITPQNVLADDELCHDFGLAAFGSMTYQQNNVRCGDIAQGTSWYTTTTSVAPYPLEYKWVRVTLKENDSSEGYTVDPALAGGNQVCWNGNSEVAVPNTTTPCSSLSPVANPVYMVTALAVAPGGARRMVQQEIAQTPSNSLNYGLYATGTTCGALTLGGGAQTFSFNSATEGTPTNPPSNVSNTGGNVGSNGNVSLNGSTTAVNGTTSSSIGGVGACNKGNGITTSGGATYGTSAVNPPQTPPTPPAPNPLPPTKGCPDYCYNSSQTLPAGSYGNVNITGGSTITLEGGTTANPAVYTMNSISLAGGSTLVVTGPVVLNIAGVNQNNPVDFTGGTFQNNTAVPGNFVLNYGGTGNVKISGGSAAYAVVNAPNANLSFTGGSSFYGQAIGATITDMGGTSIYFDQSLQTPGTNNSPFFEIALRELSY